jgi:uncharacterized protein YPO0396
MFRFIELALQDWDYFQNIRVPLHGDVVLVTGPNGSGKTTFIDAIRQLVGARRLSARRHTALRARSGTLPADPRGCL